MTQKMSIPRQRFQRFAAWLNRMRTELISYIALVLIFFIIISKPWIEKTLVEFTAAEFSCKTLTDRKDYLVANVENKIYRSSISISNCPGFINELNTDRNISANIQQGKIKKIWIGRQVVWEAESFSFFASLWWAFLVWGFGLVCIRNIRKLTGSHKKPSA